MIILKGKKFSLSELVFQSESKLFIFFVNRFYKSTYSFLPFAILFLKVLPFICFFNTDFLSSTAFFN